MFMNPIEVKNHLEKKVWAIRKYLCRGPESGKCSTHLFGNSCCCAIQRNHL